MIPTYVILIVLALLLCATAISLWLDKREARMNRQLSIALPSSHSASLPSILRSQAGSRWLPLHRLANQLFRQLPDTIELVTSTVRAGLPVNEAFRTIAREMPQPTAGQFAIVCSELSLGRPPEEAIEAVYRRTLVAEYAMFAVTLAVQLKSGGSLAETLQ